MPFEAVASALDNAGIPEPAAHRALFKKPATKKKKGVKPGVAKSSSSATSAASGAQGATDGVWKVIFMKQRDKKINQFKLNGQTAFQLSEAHFPGDLLQQATERILEMASEGHSVEELKAEKFRLMTS
eukprot:15459716-Alexandrium_andersonii.AAC.1